MAFFNSPLFSPSFSSFGAFGGWPSFGYGGFGCHAPLPAFVPLPPPPPPPPAAITYPVIVPVKLPVQVKE
jgi:hypothetical protein